jgi:tripartite-type tricarboxylate transporter receptor subunit TctC
MRRIFVRLLPLLGLLLGTVAAAAQTANYPTRSIRIVVPYAAGGIADLLARTVAQHLGPELKQTIVIENQAGAGGHLGAATVAKAPADGYTLMLATIAHNAASSMYGNLSYNPEKDLKPVILISESAGVLVVNASVPAKTVPEFIAYAKANRLSYGSAGHGSAIHLAAELFKAMAGVDLVHVPYRGSAPAMTDLLGGTVQVMFENIPTALPHIQGGRIRPLGVTSPKRSPLMPETPTIAEAGVARD